jgi:hypothetical protein
MSMDGTALAHAVTVIPTPSPRDIASALLDSISRDAAAC